MLVAISRDRYFHLAFKVMTSYVECKYGQVFVYEERNPCSVYIRRGLTKTTEEQYNNKPYRFLILAEDAGKDSDGDIYDYNVIDESDIARNDPLLIEIIKEVGEENAGAEDSEIKLVEIPDDVEWQIDCDNYGRECIVEKHRRWY